jgi:hypothetical protein
MEEVQLEHLGAVAINVSTSSSSRVQLRGTRIEDPVKLLDWSGVSLGVELLLVLVITILSRGARRNILIPTVKIFLLLLRQGTSS